MVRVMLGKLHHLPKLAKCTAVSATSHRGQLTVRAAVPHGCVSTVYRHCASKTKIGPCMPRTQQLHTGCRVSSQTELAACCHLDNDPDCLSERGCNVLDQVARMSDKRCFQPSCVSLVLERLLETSYASLVDNYEWLQQNMNIAYIQLLLSGNLTTIMAPVQQNDRFPNLVDLVVREHERFTNAELVNSLVALLYLATPQDHPAVTTLLIECRKRLPSFDFPSLSAMSTVVKTLPGIDPLSSRLLVQRQRALLMSEDYEWTAADLVAHCQLMMNLTLYSSPDLVLRSARSLEKILSTLDIEAEPDNLGTYVRTAQKLFTYHRADKMNARNVLASITTRSRVDSTHITLPRSATP